MLGLLPAGSEVTCFDPNYAAEQLDELNRAAPAGLAFTRDAAKVEFDWLLMLDVIEHVPDDFALLTNLVAQKLRPGGYALISVPAWPQLFTRRDAILGHYRRYRPEQLDSVVGRSGLERIDHGSLFSCLLLPRFATKLGERLRGVNSVPPAMAPDAHADTDVTEWEGSRWLTSAVTWVLRQDGRVGHACSRLGLVLPGLSAWTLGRKSEVSR
jgi:hypothetical protein